MISYKKLLALLEAEGYNSYRIKKENLIGQATFSAIKKGTGGLDHRSIDKLCRALNCQPGDLMEYVPDEPLPPPLESDLLSEDSLRRLIENQLNESNDQNS